MSLKSAAVAAAFLFGGLFASSAQADVLVSSHSNLCLDAQGGSTANGTPIIMYFCSGAWNQDVQFSGSGEIRIGGKCFDAAGGNGNAGDKIVLWDCHGGPNQQWRRDGNRIVGMNDRCIDIWGGLVTPLVGIQLWDCHGGTNQNWWTGTVVPAHYVGIDPAQADHAFQTARSRNAAPVVSAGGANVVSAGGANAVAAGGANVIAAGGGNVIAPGGGN